MSAITTAREGICFDEHPDWGHEAWAALERIELALRHLTAEHGSQCQCPGCAVLREGA